MKRSNTVQKAARNVRGSVLGLPLLSLAAALAIPPAAFAQEVLFPAKVIDASTDQTKEVDYTPIGKAEKPYKICVLFPHLKDSVWVAVAYGILQQSEAANVNMNLYEAGSYENLPKQISQFDDCMESGSDAIIVGPISAAGLSQKFAEAAKKGIPVVGVANPIPPNMVPARVGVDFVDMGFGSGKGLLANLKPDEKANVVTFPGPAGSGWAESYNEGFKKAVSENPNVKVLAEKFGDTGVAVQLQLVQDALQAYPDLNVIWGTAPTAEAAIGAVAEAGRSDIKIISSYSNQAMIDALARGDIQGFSTEYSTIQGAISVDLAVRLLDKKPVISVVRLVPGNVDKASQASFPVGLAFAPANWSPVYNYTAK